MVRRRSFLPLLVAHPVAHLHAAGVSVPSLLQREGISYVAPKGWSTEDADDKEAVFLMSPQIEGGVDASLLVELPYVANGGIEQALQGQSASLRDKHTDYQERSLAPHMHAGQIFYWMLEYAATKNRLALVEQHILIPMKKGRRVLVFTSTTARMASTYLPIFKSFMGSLRLPQRRRSEKSGGHIFARGDA